MLNLIYTSELVIKEKVFHSLFFEYVKNSHLNHKGSTQGSERRFSMQLKLWKTTVRQYEGTAVDWSDKIFEITTLQEQKTRIISSSWQRWK